MEEPGGLQSTGCKELDTTERPHFHFACKWSQPPGPHFISESSFSLFFCTTAPSGWFIVGLIPTSRWLRGEESAC